MPKRKAVVRLLNPGVYETPSLLAAKYPVLVEAELCDILDWHCEVPAHVVDQIAPLPGSYERIYSLTWFNPSHLNDELAKSWEEVDINPFTAWNNLKSSRDVGAMPATLNVIR